MNKYIIIIIVIAGLLAGGIFYRVVLLPQQNAPVSTGVEKRVKIVAVKDAWKFEPENIEVNQGDKIIMEVVNEDSYDHGLAIDAYGISQRMPANSTIIIEFVATKEGDYAYYCSVPCGEGDTEGKHRTHFDMIGNIKVHAIK